MVSIHSLKVGDKIQGIKYNKEVEGTITKIHPGAVVILVKNTDNLEVIDIDKVKKKL